MTTITEPTHSPKRRRLAVSLRFLMLLVVVAGAWLGWRAKLARDQRRAVSAILKTEGGAVVYDWQGPLDYYAPVAGKKPWAPASLRKMLGDEYFQDVLAVQGGGYEENPKEILNAIGRLPNVELLNLGLIQVDPKDMAELLRMKSLRILTLSPRMRISDEMVSQFSGLTNLNELFMDGSKVETGTKYLVGMNNLRLLSLSQSRLTDEGLEYLVALPGLRELRIQGTPLSEAAVKTFIARRPDVRVEYAFPERPRVPQPEISPR